MIKEQLGFSGGSDGKESDYNTGDAGLIPGSGRSPGQGNGHPLQYSCLENPLDQGTWRATVHGGVVVGEVVAQRVRHNGVTNTFTFFFLGGALP